MKQLVFTLFVIGAPVASAAETVDLSGWTFNNFSGSSNWQVQGAENDSVFQSVNGYPTVFFEAGSDAQGTSLSGTITVETTGDDDFIGFVLGYQDGEFGSSAADFWLIDWKQLDQSLGGTDGLAEEGLALSHVSGDLGSATGYGGLWGHTGVVTEVQRATNLGDTGWDDNTTYTFDLIFTDFLIEVLVDGVVELSYTSDDHGSLFTDGAFGFYNNSQGSVRYAGITEGVVEPPVNVVPLPAGLPMLIAGLGALGLVRRRRG